MFHQPHPAFFQPNPFHPLCELGYRQIDPFIPQRGALRFSETAWQTKAWGDARGQPAVSSPIHNLACLCRCRLPPWKPAVPGCAAGSDGSGICNDTVCLVPTGQDKHSLHRHMRTCLRGTQSLGCLGVSNGESWRWLSFRMDEDFSPPYMDLICTSKEKGITGDERSLNKRF